MFHSAFPSFLVDQSLEVLHKTPVQASLAHFWNSANCPVRFYWETIFWHELNRFLS